MTDERTTLSSRGFDLATNPARIDLEIFAEASQNLYHPKTNKKGTFPLNIAENALSASLVKDKLNSITQKKSMPDWVLKYTDSKGHPEVRENIAKFMKSHLCKCPIDADSIAFSAGASAIIEVSSFVLANPKDVAVIPAPSYPMYTNDMGIKSKIERYDLNTHYYLNEFGETTPAKPSMLQQAKEKLNLSGKCFKILLLTSPDNPTGYMYSSDELTEIADWCIQNKVHMIVNEIYGLSLINTSHKFIKNDYKQKTKFRSFARIMRKQKSPFLHLWYAFSKDFAMSGLRFGVVHSLNKSFLEAFGNTNIPHMVSNYTQWMVGEMLKDDDFVAAYIKQNKKSLNRSYLLVVKFLKKLDIPYIPSRGSLFVWADLSRFMKVYNHKGEEDLWLDIYKHSGVLLTPGEGFQHRKKGLFRIVFTAVPYEHLKVALKRLKHYFESQ